MISFLIYFCHPFFTIAETSIARVAKLVDALSSGGSVRKDVLVRIQSRAQKKVPTIVIVAGAFQF